MANIKDVAKLAGVSSATVSRYFSQRDMLSAKTIKKVSAAVSALNYQPNALARSLITSRAGAVMILSSSITNPFLSSVVRWADKVAHKRGYSVLLGDTDRSQEMEARYIDRIQSRIVDGFLQFSSNVHPIMQQRENAVPFVNVCECQPNATYPTVQVDNFRAAQRATEFLISLGHKRIACLIGWYSDDYPSPVTVERLRGFQTALDIHNLEVDARWVMQGDYSLQFGYDAAESLVNGTETRPTAVFAASDEMAIGLIRGLNHLGLRVPEDVSVIGFDDILMSRYINPPLTTVRQSAQEIGERAMHMLLDKIEGKPLLREHITVEHELIVRGSTAPPLPN